MEIGLINIINRLKQIENGVRNSYIADSSIKIQANIDGALKSGREVTEEIYKLSIQLNGAKTALINADKNSSSGMKVSYGILYRGDNREGLSKTTNKSAKMVDRKENLFEEAKDKAEDFIKFVSSKTKKIVDNAPSELEEAFKETEDFVSKAIDRLNKSLADFKYIAGSVATHPLLFMYGLSNSVVDNFTGDKTLQEAIKHNYEYRFETDKDYKSLTALKAGETTGDLGSMAAGGALMEGGGAVDGAGYVLAVPTLGTVTVPAEAVGTTAIAAGGLILGKSSLKLGSDEGSLFKYADMGEKNSIRNVYDSIKKAPQYPEGFQSVSNGTTKNNVKNGDVLNELRNVESGQWKKIYKDGYDAKGNKVSIHYFQSQSGKVFNVKVKKGWSNK